MAADRAAAPGLLGAVRTLVLAHGWHASSYQIVDPALAHWFDPAGDAVVGYLTQGRRRIVAGAPVAAAARLGDVLAAFAAEAPGARVLCFLAEAPLQAALPGGAFQVIGAQPVWDPARFARDFGPHRSLRMQLHRAANKGVQVAEWPGARAAGCPALATCLAEWLATRRSPPLHLLAGPLQLPDLRDRRVFVATRGEPVGYLLLAPVPARRGYMVEQIVRGRGATNGVSETLLHAAATALAAEGVPFLTLGCAPLSRMRGAGGRLGVALRAVRRVGRRCYDFDGIEAFKSKFRPEGWEPLYLATPARRLVLADLLAVARAAAGGALLPFGWRALRRALRDRVPR